jgi:diacylglycerol kinase
MINVPKFLRSVPFALKGLVALVRSENNARIHLAATGVVVVAGVVFQVSGHDWLWLTLAVTLVWLTEAVNTALEKLVNLVSPDYHPLAGQVKDLAAAAVLLSALFALVVAGIVFLG